MKKLSSLLLFAMFCAAPFIFSRCEPEPTADESLAMLVDGTWYGQMDIRYRKDGMTYASTGTYVQFWNSFNSTTSGHGKWCNLFEDNAPITSFTYDFSWEAKDQVIYLQFNTESTNSDTVDKAKMKIDTFKINRNMFSGKVSNMDNSKSSKFKFVHAYSPSWEFYIIYPWDYYPFYPWYDPWFDPWYDPWF